MHSLTTSQNYKINLDLHISAKLDSVTKMLDSDFPECENMEIQNIKT